MTVRLPASVLDRYQRASLYNSPYPAHDSGCAVDLYPGPDGDDASPGTPGSTTRAPSPVAGEVLDVRAARAPDRDYAADRDHLLLVDVDAPESAAGLVARILHVDPAVEPGDRVDVGEDLGRLLRSGYYAPWVDNHLHLGFRRPDDNLKRASGSLPLSLGVDVDPVAWDGEGRVVEAGETYAVLDAPAHPDPGSWAGVAAEVAVGDGAGGEVAADGSAGEGAGEGPDGETATGVLDGGLSHYDGGGVFGVDGDGPVFLAGDRAGVAAGRDVTWDDVTVLANGDPVTGLSLFLARDAAFGAKLVARDADFTEGEHVTVEIRRN